MATSLRPDLLVRRLPAVGLAAALLMPPVMTAASLPPAAQDAVYLRTFKDGEAAFLAGRWDEARKALETARFGLAGDLALKSKAGIYLGLSLYNLGARPESAEVLGRTLAELGALGPDGLDLSAPVRSALDKVVKALKIAPKVAAEPAKVEFAPAASVAKPAPEFKKAESPPDAAGPKFSDGAASGSGSAVRFRKPDMPLNPDLKSAGTPSPAAVLPKLEDLETRHRAAPGDPAAAAALCRGYLRAGRVADARGVLDRVPAVSAGDFDIVFSRAVLNYAARDFRRSLEGFHRLDSPAFAPLMTPDRSRRVLVYTVLCLNAMGMEPALRSYLEAIRQKVSPEELGAILAEEGLSKAWGAMLARRAK